MAMSMPTNTSNTNTPSIGADALSFRESQDGYISVEAPHANTVEENLETKKAEADTVLEDVKDDIDQTNTDTDAEKTKTADTLVTTGVSAIGVGASIGAVIGTCVFPAVGTVVGAAIGAVIGAIICLGCVIASVFVRPAKEPTNYMEAGSQMAEATATGAESIDTIQSGTAEPAPVVDTTTSTTTSPAPVSTPAP